MFLRTEIPDHSANSGQQKDEADHAPHNRSASRTVADQLFMWPVLRIGDVLARPVGARRPCGPPEECRHLPLFYWVTQRPCRDGVCVAAIAIYIRVIARQFLKCRCA